MPSYCHGHLSAPKKTLPNKNFANNVYKHAVMQTGLIVQVPLFINVGERINVKTEDNSYTGRAQSA